MHGRTDIRISDRLDWTGQHDHEVDGDASSAFFFCDMCYYQLLVLEFSAACVTCFLFDFIRAYFHIVNQPQAEVDTIRLELEWCFVFFVSLNCKSPSIRPSFSSYYLVG